MLPLVQGNLASSFEILLRQYSRPPPVSKRNGILIKIIDVVLRVPSPIEQLRCCCRNNTKSCIPVLLYHHWVAEDDILCSVPNSSLAHRSCTINARLEKLTFLTTQQISFSTVMSFRRRTFRSHEHVRGSNSQKICWVYSLLHNPLRFVSTLFSRCVLNFSLLLIVSHGEKFYG